MKVALSPLMKKSPLSRREINEQVTDRSKLRDDLTLLGALGFCRFDKVERLWHLAVPADQCYAKLDEICVKEEEVKKPKKKKEPKQKPVRPIVVSGSIVSVLEAIDGLIHEKGAADKADIMEMLDGIAQKALTKLIASGRAQSFTVNGVKTYHPSSDHPFTLDDVAYAMGSVGRSEDPYCPADA